MREQGGHAMNCVVVIPSYEPDERILGVAGELVESGRNVVVVNDGSGWKYRDIFGTLKARGCIVLNHAVNKGKGETIRTALQWILEEMPETDAIITADGDGQHKVQDAEHLLHVFEKENPSRARLVMGVRDFSSGDVPLRSRIGNRFSSMYFRMSTGHGCPDTQTGLRVYPKRMFDLMMKTEGSRYEYEMNVLNAVVKTYREEDPLLFVPVETVYEENNSSSHFHAVKDSVRIYKAPLKYLLASLSCALVDLGLFTLLCQTGIAWMSILAATVIARMVSGMVNFSLNRRWTFRASNGNALVQAARYLILFLSQMLASGLLVSAVSSLGNATVLKAVVDSALAVISFLVQKKWVFRKEESAVPMHQQLEHTL